MSFQFNDGKATADNLISASGRGDLPESPYGRKAPTGNCEQFLPRVGAISPWERPYGRKAPTTRSQQTPKKGSSGSPEVSLARLQQAQKIEFD